jgi:hypothetical protein
MSTTRNANLRTRRCSPKTLGSVRVVAKKSNQRLERQRNFRYHHYA